MKSILRKIIGSFAVVLFAAVSAYAQVPQGFNFQAVARDANGDILANTELGVQVSLIKGSEGENPLYEESHSVTTNPLGLIQLVIGEGIPGEGQSFSAIDFGNDNYFVKLAIDPAGGKDYADLGTTRLLSVPYALVAQKAVEGGSGDFSLDLGLNTSGPDTSFVINIEGDKTAKPFQVFSRSTGFNGAVWGEAISEASNPNNQRGTYGMANGFGTGQHTGIFGGAVNFDATGGSRTGIYGQAASKAKFNFGARALAQGDGSGELVPVGDPEEQNGNFGSYNIAGGFYSQGNLNGNTGVEAVASGDKGSRINFGVIGASRTTAEGFNVGIRAEATGSTNYNTGFEGEVNGSTNNLGLRLNVYNGTSNVGMEVNADTAAILNGHSIINGDLTVNGTINGSMGNGNASGQILDSLFVSTVPEAEYQRNTSFYPGFIRNTDQDGNFVTLSRRALQYGDTESDGTGNVYNWYNKGGMQVANADYRNGERSAGMSGGYFYMDIAQNDNFYLPVELGVSNAAEGGRSSFRMSSLAMKEAGKGDLFAVNVVNDPNGSDPNGEVAEMSLYGTDSPNIRMGGKQWGNSNLGYLAMFGSTGNGGGWYHSNANLSVDSDGTDEWGSMNFSKTNIAGQTIQETININGQNGQIYSKGIVVNGDLEQDRLNNIFNGSISGGQNAYNHGFVLNHDSNNGSLLQMYDGGVKKIDINGDSGTITAISVNQSSDVRLKKDIQTLDNALEKAMKMRGVSYKWKTDVSNENPQIGVIAQEVEKIYPEFVRTDENGMKSVNYAQMTAVLIEAVKELNSEIKDLKNDNAALQAKADKQQELERRLSRIEKLLGSGSTASSKVVTEK